MSTPVCKPAMVVDYASLQAKVDERIALLKIFEKQMEVVGNFMPILADLDEQLTELMVCYSNLDRDAKMSLPSHVCTMMATGHFGGKLLALTGDTTNNLGLRHLFDDPSKENHE